MPASGNSDLHRRVRRPGLPRMAVSALLGGAVAALLLPLVALASMLFLERAIELAWHQLQDVEGALRLIVLGSLITVPLALVLGVPILVIAYQSSVNVFVSIPVAGVALGVVAWLGVPFLVGSFNSEHFLFSIVQGAALGGIGSLTSVTFLAHCSPASTSSSAA